MFSYALRAFAAVFALLYTLFSIHACSRQTPVPQEAAVEAAAQPEEESGAVHILQSQGDISQHLQDAITRYQEGNAVRIQVQTVASETDYRLVLRSKLLAGEQVDLFHIFGYRDALDLEANLVDLSQEAWVLGAVEGTLDGVTVDGRVYGSPYSVEGFGFLANRNIFEVAGIPLAGIHSFESMAEAFEELDGLIREGELAEDFPGLEAVTELPALDRDYLGTGLADVAVSGAFSTPEEAALAEYLSFPAGDSTRSLVDLLALYSAVSPARLTEVPLTRQVEDGLAAGRVAVILQSTDLYSKITALDPNLENRIALVPVYPEGREGAVFYSVPCYWAVNSASTAASRDNALDFLEWLYTAEEGAVIVGGKFGAASPYRDTARETSNPLHSQLLGYLDRGAALPRLYREYPDGWGQLFGENIQAYFTGDLEWEDLLQLSMEQWHARR